MVSPLTPSCFRKSGLFWSSEKLLLLFTFDSLLGGVNLLGEEHGEEDLLVPINKWKS